MLDPKLYRITDSCMPMMMTFEVQTAIPNATNLKDGNLEQPSSLTQFLFRKSHAEVS